MIRAFLTLAVSMMAFGTVKAAEAVDLEKYSGVWYEIARIPQSFEADCVSNVKAEYTVLSENVVKVVNSCTTATGEVKSVTGLAQATDPGVNNNLIVSFEPLESNEDPADVDAWDFSDPGQYQILEVGPDYSYAIVGHPDKTSAWVLSRTPDMDSEALLKAEDTLVVAGYDTCLLMTTVQDGGLTKSSQLCSVKEGTTPPDETTPPEDGTTTPPEEDGTLPPDDGSTPGDQSETPALLDVLQTSGQFSEFLAAVEVAGLTETLSAQGPYTIFVPSDEAFAKIPAEKKQELMENPEALSQLLLGHVMMGTYKAADLESLAEPKNALNGDMTFATVDGVQQVNGVNIVMADVEASNGTIHVIDTVLME